MIAKKSKQRQIKRYTSNVRQTLKKIKSIINKIAQK